MKFRPPVVEIPTDDPFKNDALGPDRRKLGESLASVFKEIEDNLVVCLDAAWGEGKTTFVEMW